MDWIGLAELPWPASRAVFTSERSERVEREADLQCKRLPRTWSKEDFAPAKSLSRAGALPRSVIELLLIWIAMLVMAKHGGRGRGRRRAFNLRRVRVQQSLAPGALATGDVTVGPLTAAITDPLRIVSVNFTYAITDVKAVPDDGFEFGLAHSDYTAAEIEECLENQSAIDLGDKIAQEQANRLVRHIGIMTGQTAVNAGYTFNDGRPVKTKLNWRMSSGDTLNLWIRNASDTVWTTGSNLVSNGDMWIKDL